MAETREAPFGHEPPGVATRKVVGVVLTLGTAVAIALVLLWLALTHWVMPHHAQLKTQPAVLPPAPRLQPHPDDDLTALREEKRELLDSYMWVDKAHRFARIPIERAMQIYVAEQKRKAATGNRGQGTGAGTPAPSASTSGPGTGDRGPGNSSGLGTRDSGLGNQKPGAGTGDRGPGNNSGPGNHSGIGNQKPGRGTGDRGPDGNRTGSRTGDRGAGAASPAASGSSGRQP